MDDDDIELCGLACSGLDHALEFGPAVVGGGSAWLDVGLDELITARDTVRFALSLLIGNRDIVLGLPRRGDAQIQRGARNGTVIQNVLSDHRRGRPSTMSRFPIRSDRAKRTVS